MSEKKEFIKEKIVKKTGAGKGFRNFIKILAAAIIFGVVAAGVFALSTPWAQKHIGKQEETVETEFVTIPRDEPETLSTVVQSQEETETAPEDGELINDTVEEESTEPVEDIVQEVMEGYNYSVSDLSSMWNNVAELCNDIDSSVVTVRTRSVDKDMFDNERSHEGEYSGIIIAETDTQVVILTRSDVAGYEEDLTVEMSKDEILDAEIKAVDTQLGLAVIGIDKKGMSQETIDDIVTINLGNSYQIRRGDMLLAVGSPVGVVHSTGYDWVSYIEKDVPVIDGTESHIYIGGQCDSDKGSWILNIDGQLIGWSARNPENENSGAKTANNSSSNMIIGISEYKSILERMVNAGKFAYIGLKLAQIPETEGDTPKGLYVVEVAKGSPAYDAGILAGDTLMELCNVDMRSLNSYVKVLENLNSGTEVEAVVSRDAIDEYKEISYEITVGERK